MLALQYRKAALLLLLLAWNVSIKFTLLYGLLCSGYSTASLKGLDVISRNPLSRATATFVTSSPTLQGFPRLLYSASKERLNRSSSNRCKQPVSSLLGYSAMPTTSTSCAAGTFASQQTIMPPAPSVAKPKRIFVLGGDGFCGWPTSLYLAAKGHEIIIIDNFSRRKIDVDLGTDSLTPISSLEMRLHVWNKLNRNTLPAIRHYKLNIAKQYTKLLQILRHERPDAIIHFAEQRAAPYSMKGSNEKRYTVENNLAATNNVLCAVVESEMDIHVIHLGTMGVYGYSTSGEQIPEGYIDIELRSGKKQSILHPANPGSIYHTTKCLDALLFQFYNRNDGLCITDLHQGIVWGTNTAETMLDERLLNRFDYDSDYGTVLNRFIVQSALGIPLTVYGTGRQTRAFINIQDTCKCIELAIAKTSQIKGKVEILNQVAETIRLIDLAKLISEKTGVDIHYLSNPRQEASANELEVSNEKFKSFGLDAIKFDTELIKEIQTVAERYKHRVNHQKIVPSSFWNKQRAEIFKSSHSDLAS